MLVSIFPTPFDHFHFHGSARLVSKLILTPCQILKNGDRAENCKLSPSPGVQRSLSFPAVISIPDKAQ